MHDMIPNKTACAFTGHRPEHFSFRYDETHDHCVLLKTAIGGQIKQLIQEGVTDFYTGMALGVDQWAAALVLELKREYPNIRLIAVRPCETQADRWPAHQRETYFEMHSKCDEVVLTASHFFRGCFLVRNDYLVDHAGILLAVYDGGKEGGTAYTVRKAKEKGRDIILINPDTRTVLTLVGKPEAAGAGNTQHPTMAFSPLRHGK